MGLNKRVDPNRKNSIEATSHLVFAIFILINTVYLYADLSSASTLCPLVTTAPSIICINDDKDYTYSSAPTPGGFNQRWWIVPPGFVFPPQGIAYNNYTGANGLPNYKQSDGSSMHVRWNQEAGTISGEYILYTGYYHKNNNTLKDFCSMQVDVIALPSNKVIIP